MHGRSVAAAKLRDLRICTATFLLAVSCPAIASNVPQSLQPDVRFEDYIHRKYYVRDGLPSNTINDVLQTRDGYLWVATNNGLARFDGHRFTTFNRSNTPQLPANNVESLWEAGDGTVWIGTEGGIAKYHAGSPGSFARIEELYGMRTNVIFELRPGLLWAYCAGRTRSSQDGTHFELEKDAPPGGLRHFCVDRDGTTWVSTRMGLYQETDQGYVKFESPHLAFSPDKWTSASEVTQLLANDDGTIWVGTSTGLFLLRDGVLEPQAVKGYIYKILRTRTDGLYVISEQALIRLVGDDFEQLAGTELEFCDCLAEDREGGLWVGKVDGKGLHYYRNHRVQFRFSERYVYCVLKDRQQRIWLGLDDGLYRWADGKITKYGIEDGIPGLPVRALAQGAGETLWIGTAKGIAKWSGSSIVPQVEPRELTDLNVVSLHESHDGSLWIGPFADANKWRKYRLVDHRLEEFSGVGSNINSFHEDVDGRMWIATDGGLFRQNRDRFERIRDNAVKKLGSSHFNCFYSSGDGSLWIGTRGGLVRYRSATSRSENGQFDVFTAQEGLPVEFIERIHGDHRGNLWMGGRHGFFSVSKNDLESVAAHRLVRVRADLLTDDERFAHARVGMRGTPTSCLENDGTLWITVGHGAIAIPPERLGLGRDPPPVYIEHVRVDDQTVNIDQGLEFSSGAKRLAIDFSAPAFANPGRVQAKYRLLGHDDDWVDAGEQRVAFYTDLRPGQYEFQVTADNAYGEWNEAGRTLGVTVKPRWWETTLARLAAAVTALGLTATYFRCRTRRIHKANAALRREIADRKRAEEESRRHFEQLARVSRAASMGELTTSIAHEVKQPLYAIVSNAQTAVRMLDTDQPDVPEVREALNDIQAAGDRATNIIDHIRSLVRKDHHSQQQLDLSALASDVIKLVDPELRKRGLVIRTEMAESLPAVRGNPIELQQVILNLINNGIQAMSNGDAGTRELLVTTSTNNDSVKLAVQDSGVGLGETDTSKMFDAFFTTKPDGTGMGLAINRTIIEAHGGRIWAAPNADRGATFQFSLPISNGEDH